MYTIDIYLFSVDIDISGLDIITFTTELNIL